MQGLMVVGFIVDEILRVGFKNDDEILRVGFKNVDEKLTQHLSIVQR